MEKAGTSEKMVLKFQIIRRHKPEYRNSNSHLRKNLQSHKKIVSKSTIYLLYTMQIKFLQWRYTTQSQRTTCSTAKPIYLPSRWSILNWKSFFSFYGGTKLKLSIQWYKSLHSWVSGKDKTLKYVTVLNDIIRIYLTHMQPISCISSRTQPRKPLHGILGKSKVL
jgi:hypothetical protein